MKIRQDHLDDPLAAWGGKGHNTGKDGRGPVVGPFHGWCSCGWEGPERETTEQSDADLVMHLEGR